MSNNNLANCIIDQYNNHDTNPNVITNVLDPLLHSFPNVSTLRLQGNGIGLIANDFEAPQATYPNIKTLHVRGFDIRLSNDNLMKMFPKCKDIFIHNPTVTNKKKYRFDTEAKQETIIYNTYTVHLVDGYSNNSSFYGIKAKIRSILFKILIIFLGAGFMSGIGSLIGLGLHNFPDHITGIPLDKLSNSVQKSTVVFAVFSAALVLLWESYQMTTSKSRKKKFIGELGLIGSGAFLGAVLGSFITLPGAHGHLNSVQLGAVYGAALMVGFYFLKQIFCSPAPSKAAKSGGEDNKNLICPD